MLTPAATLDQAVGFTITQRHARGRLVRLGPVLDAVLAAHAYPPAIERTLASGSADAAYRMLRGSCDAGNYDV